jgi:hypothetical protein
MGAHKGSAVFSRLEIVEAVSDASHLYALLLDAAANAHGVRSSMRLWGCPAVIGSRVATI